MVESAIRVARARLRPAGPEDKQRGLIGFLAVELVGGLSLDGLTLRRSERGGVYVAYPAKVLNGERRYSVRPTNEAARRRLEREILAAIERDGGEAR